MRTRGLGGDRRGGEEGTEGGGGEERTRKGHKMVRRGYEGK